MQFYFFIIVYFFLINVKLQKIFQKYRKTSTFMGKKLYYGIFLAPQMLK